MGDLSRKAPVCGSVLSIALLLATLLPGRSAIAEAWEIKAGLGPVFGTEFSSQQKDGLGAQAYLDLGVNEVISLTVGGGYVRHFIGDGQAYYLANAGAGVVVNLDVVFFGVGLAWVPYISARIGFLNQHREGQEAVPGLGMSTAVGLDYVFDENYSVGLAFEYQGMLTDLKLFPAYLGITGRVGLRFLD